MAKDLIPFRELVRSIRSILEHGFVLQSRGVIPKWDGPMLETSRILATSFSIPERLTEGYLEGEHEQGRDLLDVVIGIALHLGIERGLVVAEEDWETKIVPLGILLHCGEVGEAKNLLRFWGFVSPEEVSDAVTDG